MEKSDVVEIVIDGFEKRRDGGKHYVYRIKVKYASKKVDIIWRRYRQFDALKSTIDAMLGDEREGEKLPKLTPKKYIGRSSVRHVADSRKPRLQAFLTGVLEHAQVDPKMMTTLTFFLTPTTADNATKLVSATPTGDDSDSDEEEGTHGAVVKGVVIGAHTDGKHGQPLHVGDVVDIGADDLCNPFMRPDGDFVFARLPTGARGLVRLSAIDTSEGAVERSTPTQAPVRSAAAELLNTERLFVDELVEVRDHFFPKLRAILSAPEAKCFFSNWAELIARSADLRDALAAPGCDVAQVMCDMLPTLQEPYSKYCQGIPAAQALYEKKLLEKDFVRFEQSFPTLNKPTLNHFMRPVQRIMKYPLLLGEIKKERVKAAAKALTAPVDTAVIESALDIASGLALDANATMNKPIETLHTSDISGPNEGSYVHLTSIIGTGNNKTADANNSKNSSGGDASVAAATPPTARTTILQRFSRRHKTTPTAAAKAVAKASASPPPASPASPGKVDAAAAHLVADALRARAHDPLSSPPRTAPHAWTRPRVPADSYMVVTPYTASSPGPSARVAVEAAAHAAAKGGGAREGGATGLRATGGVSALKHLFDGAGDQTEPTAPASPLSTSGLAQSLKPVPSARPPVAAERHDTGTGVNRPPPPQRRPPPMAAAAPGESPSTTCATKPALLPKPNVLG